MTSKEIKDWYQKEFDRIDLKALIMPIIRSEYYDLLNEKIAKFKPMIPQGGPITEVLSPILKQLRPGWTVIQQPDANIIEQQISYCKRCNVQNEYMKFNPDWTCLSCRS